MFFTLSILLQMCVGQKILVGLINWYISIISPYDQQQLTLQTMKEG